MVTPRPPLRYRRGSSEHPASHLRSDPFQYPRCRIAREHARPDRPGGSVPLDGDTISGLFPPNRGAFICGGCELPDYCPVSWTTLVVTTSQVYHFDVPMVTRSTVSWSQVRDVGPLIDHTRQISGSRALDLGIYNLVVQNEGGPDLAR